MDQESPKTIAHHAQAIRRWIIRMLLEAGSGHPGGALGLADIFATLYFSILKHRPTDPEWDGRDRVLLSNGHTNPALYATLALAGYFPKDELLTLRKIGSRLQGHPHRGALPGIENTSGPLGQGLSQACGLAAGLRLQGKTNRVFCILSDGEHDEGQTWEAYLFGAKEKLANLTVIVDRNNIQIDGRTEDVLPLDSLVEKIMAFGWHVLEIDGHNYDQILQALSILPTAEQQLPTAIICRTTPGKGVSFMENNFEWHGKKISEEDAKVALRELGAEDDD
ncbi:transketolase [Candidatus Woesebacteria bacterium]|nr:transketolase [Candidatus Woesebacteria bacterium]